MVVLALGLLSKRPDEACTERDERGSPAKEERTPPPSGERTERDESPECDELGGDAGGWINNRRLDLTEARHAFIVDARASSLPLALSVAASARAGKFDRSGRAGDV
jgi:hypothetical protein